MKQSRLILLFLLYIVISITPCSNAQAQSKKKSKAPKMFVSIDKISPCEAPFGNWNMNRDEIITQLKKSGVTNFDSSDPLFLFFEDDYSSYTLFFIDGKWTQISCSTEFKNSKVAVDAFNILKEIGYRYFNVFVKGPSDEDKLKFQRKCENTTTYLGVELMNGTEVTWRLINVPTHE